MVNPLRSLAHRFRVFGVRTGVLALLSGPAALAQEAGPAPNDESVAESICRIIEKAAVSHDLPAGFLSRLIWRESSFRSYVVSPAGAQGIAQFMPGTAGERGLADPFDPETAIPKAAEFLADLKKRFGNWGLAAAAYNAGPARVSGWQAGRSELPFETREYVVFITRHVAEDWNGDNAPKTIDDSETILAKPCLETIALIRRGSPLLYASSPLVAPWGVQLAGNFSKAAALSAYERARTRHPGILAGIDPMVLGSRLRSRGSRPFYRVRTPAPTRAAAIELCNRIQRAGGACVVLRS